MKKSIFALVAAVAALTAFQPTQAQANEGFYLGGFGGANFIQTKKHDEKFRTGYVFGGSLGYKWCQGFRVEGEVSYRHNRLKSHNDDSSSTVVVADAVDTSSSSGDHHTHGHLATWGFMANALYDMDLRCWDSCNSWDIVPYVGAGIGYSNQKIKRGHHDEVEGIKDTKENGFAWQLIAGLAYEISPCADIDLEYRFFKGKLNKVYNHAAALAVKYHF